MTTPFVFLDPLFNAFRRHRKKLFLVGGCVRDYLLNPQDAQIKDFDLCTDATVEETQRILNKLTDFCRPVEKNGGNFGTVFCSFLGQDVEITTFRKNEEYAAGSRNPDLDKLQFSKNVEDDLVRRDFTINAIAMDQKGNLAHPMCEEFLNDLRLGILRTPQEPNTLMRDDPLRILRMYRFAHRLGLMVDPELRQAARNNATRLGFIVNDRIHDELVKISAGQDPHLAFREMMADGVLQQFLPDLAKQVGQDMSQSHGRPVPQWEHTLKVVEFIFCSNVRRGHIGILAALLHELKVENVMRDLKFSTKDIAAVSAIVRDSHIHSDTFWDEVGARRFVANTSNNMELVFAMLAAQEIAREPMVLPPECSFRSLEGFLMSLDVESLKNVMVPVSGEDVKRLLDIKPGPKVGEVLKKLRQSIIDGYIETAEQAFDFVLAHK